MNIHELKDLAQKLKIPFRCYSFEGGFPSEAYCIVRSQGKWEIYYSERGGKNILGVFDTEAEACEAFYRILKSIENTVYSNEYALPHRKRKKIPTQWWITNIVISSRSSADISFEEKTVRIPGERMAHYFLADPYEMFWLAQEDRDVLPWNLAPERRRKLLSQAERSAVMDAVKDYFRYRKDPILFLTRELEDRTSELAERIGNGQISRWKAVAMLKEEFPDYLDEFYTAMITDSLAGARWY